LNLKIIAYSDCEFKSVLSGVQPYATMINPESISIEKNIGNTNNEGQVIGTQATLMYKNTPVQKMSFEIVIDCTGIVDGIRTDLKKEIDHLEEIIYAYNGDYHRPNYVKILWGNIEFNSLLENYSLKYTLFNNDGMPLRAKATLSFGRYLSKTMIDIIEGRKSPDITQLITVQTGDILPQLCNRVWNSSENFVQVARYNELNKFRHLKGGTKIIFPPILE